MKPSLKTLAVTTILASVTGQAYASYAYYPFSSVEISYTPSDPVYPLATGQLYVSSEQWEINQDQGTNPDSLADFGSPGVGGNYATYAGTGSTPTPETESAIGFVIYFTGATVSSDEVTLGNSSDCTGGSGGGTVFCNEFANTSSSTPDTPVQWTASLVTSGGNSGIEFLAPSPASYQTVNSQYFVNIFFTATASNVPNSFSGDWIYLSSHTGPSLPEPATLAVLGIGVAGLGMARRRRRHA